MRTRPILLFILSFTLLDITVAKKGRSRKRHKVAASSKHTDSEILIKPVSLELLQDGETTGVTKVNEDTWKFRSKSLPVKTSQSTTAKALEDIISRKALSLSLEVKPGSKRKSSIFHAFSNSTGIPISWLNVELDSIRNSLTIHHATQSLASESLELMLPEPSYRSWTKIFLTVNSTSATIYCRIGCTDGQTQELSNGINTAFPRDTTIEIGGNTFGQTEIFVGQIRQAFVHIPATMTAPWTCDGSDDERTESPQELERSSVQSDEPTTTAKDERLEIGTDFKMEIDELRAQMQECRSENKDMENMIRMMKQTQASLEERITALESCECIPMCVLRSGLKKRHGEVWTVGNCTTCECSNGVSSCKTKDGCGQDICSSNPCQNQGLCEPDGEEYSCRCRLGFYGDQCELVDQCIRGICQNGGECTRLDDGGYNCKCRDGFTGINCEREPLNHCASGPCLNSGVCTSVGTGYICHCLDGFTGRCCQDHDDCYSTPCLNRGLCTSLSYGGYFCRCQAGYFGRNCELRDGCQSSPCLNGGRCTRGSESYEFSCQCSENFEGIRCERRAPCSSNPCQNGGRCTPDRLVGTRFTCECLRGFTGPQCEDRLLCSPNPCANGGRCEEPIRKGETYTCTCIEGFTGPQCEDRLLCSPNPCSNRGRCVEPIRKGESYSCVCVEGYTGSQCRDRTLCASNPCLNGGRCIPEGLDNNTFTCVCTEGFTGLTCEDRDFCRVNPCVNGGRCENVPSRITGMDFTCYCLDSFVGPRCELHDSCSSSPCLNGGECRSLSMTDDDGSLLYTCRCPDGYLGDNCERQSLCASNPCLNDGVCESLEDGGFRCRCRVTHYGARCENTDYCRANPCTNGATCVNKPSEYGQEYTCNCLAAYMGPNCEVLDLCGRHPCLNGGTCSMEGDQYVCKCRDAYSGRRCENTDFCAENPCLNGGRCENEESGSGFRCICPETHTGNRCQNRHPCRPNPCLNNGICRVVGTGSYSCECAPGRTGQRCHLINNCYRNPCENGGECLNDGDAFTCNCLDGFSGETCELINACAVDPCLNGGECVPELGRYKCKCKSPYTGERCESPLNVCTFDKAIGEYDIGSRATETRWYFDKHTQRCKQFEYAGCGGNGNNFATRQACRQRCTIGACCMIAQSETSYRQSSSVSYECQTIAVGQCKRMDTQRNEFQVISFNSGVECRNYECGAKTSCQFRGKEYSENARIDAGCGQSCVCRGGNIQCRCEQKSLRREIRRLTAKERISFQTAVRKLKLETNENGHNSWDILRDEYITKIPIAQSAKYFLLWNRAFLRRMEMELQQIDCNVTLPYYDFTQDAGRFNESIIWQPNYFGGDGECVPDHPFRTIHNGNADVWNPCVTRKFDLSINIPSMLDVASALRSSSYIQLSAKLLTLVSYVNQFIGGDMEISSRAYDPLFYPIHAFIDHIFMEWQRENQGTNHLSNIRLVEDIPFGMTATDIWNGACTMYADWSQRIACNKSDVSPEKFATDGYNLQGYDTQGFDRDGFDVNGYNALGRDRSGNIDTRGLYKYDGYNAEGYSRTGYDRRGFNKYGFNKEGWNRDGMNVAGFDQAGFTRYGLNAEGYDRQGYNIYGVDRYGDVDIDEHYDDKTGFNDCCFRREGLTPTGHDRYGFNVAGFDEQSCGYFFNGPHTLYYRKKLWEMLSPQRTSFFSTIARTCGQLGTIPRSYISLNWPSSLSYPLRSSAVGSVSTRDSEVAGANDVFSERYCFDVDMFLTWCPCLEENFPAICSSNPCANTHCSLHPTARCVINMCGRSCKAEFIFNGRKVNCENPCEPNPCKNGGTCEPSRYLSSAGKFQCRCRDEFVGTLCDRPAPDTCTLAKKVGNCQGTVIRWFYNFHTMECERFLYSGCGGNSNNFASKKACDLRCSLGACCYRLPKNSTFLVGYDRDGFDKYGFNALGMNRRGQRQSSHDSMPTGNRINPPKGYGYDGFDIYGYDHNGFDRQGYDRDGFHRVTGFNRTGYNPSGEYDQLREYGNNGYDASDRDRAGYTCSGIDREGFNQLGLYYDFEYHCESLHLTECEALKDPRQLEVPFEVISFSPGITCAEVQCGEECGCKVDDRIYHFGQSFELGCETCTCTLGGVIECACRRVGRRREIRDLTEFEREQYAAAIRKMYRTNQWEYATQHAQYLPTANGVPSSLPWHRNFLREVEKKIQSNSNCEVFIPYFDWTIDVGKLDESQVWQASYFGGDGSDEDNCVNHHPFMQDDVRWQPCIKRKFNKTVSLPDAVNMFTLLLEPDYENFRFQLEMMSGIFHLYVGGHMASPFSPYDPLYLSHWAFMDYVWNEWQKRNPMGITRFPAQHRYVKMPPFAITPDEVLSSEQQMCVIYVPPTIGSMCNTTDVIRWPLSVRDENGLDRHGFDENGFDVNGYNEKGFDRTGRSDARNMYDVNGFDIEGYTRSGFDSSGWDKYDYNELDFNRDGFDIEGFDASGFDRYGYDRDGKTPFGLFRNMSFAPGFDPGNAARLFDRFGYNKYGYNKNGLDARGLDIFGFREDGFDEDNCDNYFDGPHYMRFFYHARQQLSGLTRDMLENIGRICSPITLLPDYFFSNHWLGKESKARRLQEKWNSDHAVDESWHPRSSSVTSELLWLPKTPDQQFCFNLNWFSGCPLGTKLMNCQDQCSKSTCASHPYAQCRMKNCGACYPEFYNGETGETYQCYGCLSMSGDMHNEGSTWREGCNTCVCQAGLIACSPMPCPSRSCTHAAPGLDGCCDVCDSCEYDGQIYRNHARFKPNPCETCECIDGSVMCHNDDFSCPPTNCDSPIKLPGECCSTCSRDCSGQSDLGSWAMDKCTNCTCLAGRILCSKNPCPVLQCLHPRRSAGECCPACMGCEYNGEKYRHLQNFMENSCSQCSCRFGTVSCTTQRCPPLHCKYKETLPGSCCPRCRRGCEHEGAFYDNGATFESRIDPCLQCTCESGQARCSRKQCPRVSCSRPVVLEGQCCPLCLKCRRGSVLYNEGQTWTSADKCKTCECRKGESICRNIIPCRDQCTYGVMRIGHCCPDCSRCSYHGKIFRHLEQFTDPSDVCSQCSCQLGEVTCSTKTCPSVGCTTLETPAGECCPRCKSCVYDGVVKEHGSSWRIPQDPCITCSCQEGTPECEDELCSTAGCENPSTPEGSCCPKCDGCFYRGRNYRDGDIVDSGDACTTCSCQRGNINCRRKSCPRLACENPVKRAGDCCYRCETCNYEGETHYDGDTFLSPRNPCSNCTCQGGSVTCERLDLSCPRSFPCRNPGRTRTKCCPACYTCEYNRRYYRNGERFQPDPDDGCESCTCRNGDVVCATLDCEPVHCPYPIKKQNQCCPVCEECEQNGRTYSNGESWKSDSCTDCTCSAGMIQCNPVQCPLLSCSHPATASGACCPECNNCLYEAHFYRNGREFSSTSNPCFVCTCRVGTVSCTRRACPSPDCTNAITRPGECCPFCPADCEYQGSSIPNGGTIRHPNDECQQCSCTAGSVTCAPLVCPTNVGCTHPSSSGCCKDQCTDCMYRGNLIRNGEMIRLRDPCRKCTCMNGSMVCNRQRCTRSTSCESPTKMPGKCCPECQEKPKQCRHRGVTIEHGEQSTIGCKVCQCSDGETRCRSVRCPTTNCSYPVRNECCLSCANGCRIKSTTYENGEEITADQSKCDDCHCEKGNIACKTKPCASPLCSYPSYDGCCRVCEGCEYKGLAYEDGTSFPDPDDKCGRCTCEKGNVHCAPKECHVPCTHPLDSNGDCCPRCDGDCQLNGTTYLQSKRMFSLPDDIHSCSACICNSGSIMCEKKPCPNSHCKHPVINECGCSSCSSGCFYKGELRRNREKFPSPDKNSCNECYCANGDVVCGRKPCESSPCTHPTRNSCGCPTCEQCLYFGQAYNNEVTFDDPQDNCNTCQCQDGNVECNSRRCTAVDCPHPGIDGCGCRACNGCQYSGVAYDSADRFEDPENKCNECICQSGEVTCTRVQCPALPCSDPILPDGECCPICVGMCQHNGKSYADGSSITTNSDPCSSCSCSSGSIKCVRQRCRATCTHPIEQSGCCPDCSACLYQGTRHEQGDRFTPKDNSCKQCICMRGNVVCQAQECPETNCDNPRRLRGKCCPECPAPQTLECVVNNRPQKAGATWISEIAGACQECTCLESGVISCSEMSCKDTCSHPVPQIGKCCALCDSCYYQNRTYRNGMVFNPNECRSCTCSNGNVDCVKKSCPTLTCPPDKQIKNTGECCPRCKSCVMSGKVYSDNQMWTSLADPCQECHCFNGVVTCAQVQCLQPCRATMNIPGQCCPVCAGCYYQNKVYQIGESFMPNGMDPCGVCECQSSPTGAPVLCCKRMECPSLADCPRNCIRQPRPGQCCPTCDNRQECGYGYCSERMIGNHIFPVANRCFGCDCMVENTWLCMRDHCRNLDCPHSERYTPQGSCCQVCDVCHLELENIDVQDGEVWRTNECEVCRCERGTITCIQQKCPAILQCDSGNVPYKKPGDCCSECLNVNAPCLYQGESINPNHEWKPDPCTTCTCFAGKVNCVTQRCRMLTCRSDQAPMSISGECCPRCLPVPASCVAFGDPHYKTFDGRLVHFQGQCQYLMAADCTNNDFKVMVQNTKNGDVSRRVTWTEEVTMITRRRKVTLLKNYSVRLGNGTVIQQYPIDLSPDFEIDLVGNYLILKTNIGVQLSWNGQQQRVEVTVPGSYKRKMCGLCGNFNNFPQDDLRLRGSSRMATRDDEFGNSWKVITPGTPSCNDVTNVNPCEGANYAMRNFANTKCEILRSPTFAPCHALVNPELYFSTCVYDVCECGENNQACICDILEAYAAQCRRSGVIIRWRSPTLCNIMCPYDRGYVFDECGSPCKRTCANRNLPPGEIAEQCYLPCVSGCQCPAGRVEHGGRCIFPEHCPMEISSTIEDMSSMSGNMGQIYHQPVRMNRGIIQPPLMAPGRMMRHP